MMLNIAGVLIVSTESDACMFNARMGITVAQVILSFAYKKPPAAFLCNFVIYASSVYVHWTLNFSMVRPVQLCAVELFLLTVVVTGSSIASHLMWREAQFMDKAIVLSE